MPSKVLPCIAKPHHRPPQATARVFTRPKAPLAGRNPFNQGPGEKSGLIPYLHDVEARKDRGAGFAFEAVVGTREDRSRIGATRLMRTSTRFVHGGLT